MSNPFVTSDQSKNHEKHFNAISHLPRKMVSSPLSKELSQKYNRPSVQLQKDGEVQVVHGYYKGQQIGSDPGVWKKDVICIDQVH